MTAADIAAYVGAAAWAPQVVAWIYGAVSKPQLNMVSAGKIEIGFSMLGPIVNATLAISSERRDALIEKITLDVTHEHGDKRRLVWSMLSENQQQIRDAQGNISSQYKNNPAVALKVSTLALLEKTIGFQDPTFEEARRISEARTVEQFRHLETQNGNAEALSILLRSMEFAQVRREFENFMYWRAGRYDFSFRARMAGVKNPHVQRFNVELTEPDIATLRRNFELLDRYVRAALSTNTEDQRVVTWNWVYPNIREA